MHNEQLLWLSVAIDATLAIALLFGLLTSRVPRRWRLVVSGLFLVVGVHFAETIGHALLDESWAQTVSAVTHPMVVAGLVLVALVLRRQVLLPQRLLELSWKDEEERNVYLDGVSAVVATLTPDGVLRHMNKPGMELLGVTEEDIIGTDAFAAFVGRAHRKRAKEDFLRFCASGGTSGTNIEYPIKTPTGEHVIRWRRSALLNEAGDVVGVISYGDDVTEQRRMQERSKWESYLLDSVHDSVVVTNQVGAILYHNHAAHDLQGYSHEEFGALAPLAWVAPESRTTVAEQLRHATATDTVIFEVEGLCKDGHRLPVEVRSQLVEFEGHPAVLNVVRDVTERRHAQDLMAQLAFNDPLTGLPNRRLVCDRLELSLARLRRGTTQVAVLYIDVDNLKAINDTLGHDAGDRLIKKLGNRLARGVRECDTLGRVGGDEFVVIMSDLEHLADADDVARRLQELLAEPLDVDGFVLRPTASIGICRCTPDLTAEDALIRADRAMYAAKKSGGGAITEHDSSMDAAISERFRIKNELADALDRDEFEMYFQPIVDSQTCEVTAAEALIRWHHPTRGLLPPGAFIQVAEESGLIVPMGQWALASVCETIASWDRRGVYAPGRVCVNVSPVQLLHGDIVRDVADALASTGIDASRLEIEITESAAMEEIDYVMPIFAELRSMGVRIALDDFGTGHSSLERLQVLPITTLKIDQSFVADLCVGFDAHPIVDTVLVLASKMGLDVIAEGVETSCHLQYLRRAQCANLQGYLFAKPCDVQTFEGLVSSGRIDLGDTEESACMKPGGCELLRARLALAGEVIAS